MTFLLTLNSYALECASKEDPNKKLFLNTKGKFQEAIIVTEKIASILVGKKTNILGNSYMRWCPSTGDDLSKPKSTGKLEIGEEVEYFDCL